MAAQATQAVLVPHAVPAGRKDIVWENVHPRYLNPLDGPPSELYRDPATAEVGEFVRVRYRNVHAGYGGGVSTELQGPFIGNVLRVSSEDDAGRSVMHVRLSAQGVERSGGTADVVVEIIDEDDVYVYKEGDPLYCCSKIDGIMDPAEFSGYWATPSATAVALHDGSAIELEGAAARLRAGHSACVFSDILVTTQLFCCEEDALIGGTDSHLACHMTVVREMYAVVHPIAGLVRTSDAAGRANIQLEPSLCMVMHTRGLDVTESSTEAYESNCRLSGVQTFGHRAKEMRRQRRGDERAGAAVSTNGDGESTRHGRKRRRQSTFGATLSGGAACATITVDTWTPSSTVTEAFVPNPRSGERGVDAMVPCCFPRTRLSVAEPEVDKNGRNSHTFWQVR